MPPQPEAGSLCQHSPPAFGVQAMLMPYYNDNGLRWTKANECRLNSSSPAPRPPLPLENQSNTSNVHSIIGDGTIPGNQDTLQTYLNSFDEVALQITGRDALPLKGQIDEGMPDPGCSYLMFMSQKQGAK